MPKRMTTWIAGIDYSTHAIDTVYVDEEAQQPPRWDRYILEGQDAWERTRKMRHWNLQLADTVLAVGLEQPRGHGAGHLYRVQGAILCRLPATMLVQPWLPNEWRKRCGLKGNAKKDDSVAESKQLLPHGFDEWPVDAHEAHLIAIATRAALEQTAA